MLAANQGLYNGFLAAGLVWGLVAGGELRDAGAGFFLVCVVVAGVYGAATVSRRILVVQACPRRSRSWRCWSPGEIVQAHLYNCSCRSTVSDMDPEIGQARADDLATLHHPVRRRMLEFLNLTGPSTVGAIAAGLGQQVGSVSHHMKTLERAGFVEPAPELARDRRESVWRGIPRRLSWSLDRLRRVAERPAARDGGAAGQPPAPRRQGGRLVHATARSTTTPGWTRRSRRTCGRPPPPRS